MALVTGATGFVGQHLVTRLLREGHHVRVLARPTSRMSELPAGAVPVPGDLASDASLEAAVEDCDAVFHLAAAHGPQAAAEECERVNVQGTTRLASAVARAGAGRFVNASTRGVHGLVRGTAIDEDTPAAPDSPYRSSKLRAEQELARAAASNGLRYVNLRLPSMIGPGAMGWLGLYRAVSRGNFRIIGSGSNQQHPCPVDDAVSAIVAAATAAGIDGESFIFSGAESTTTAGFIGMIAAALGVPVSRVRLPVSVYRSLYVVHSAAARLRGKALPPPSTEFFTMSYRIDDRKARRLLEYVPAVPLSSAVQSLAAWYRSRGLLG